MSHFDIENRLTRLSPEKRALLAKRLSEKASDKNIREVQLPPLQTDRGQRFEPFKLVDLQQAYWIGRGTAFDMGNVASKAYVELACDDLDLDRLTAAWRRVIDRHDMLRLIVMEDGRQQVLEEVPPYRIQIADLTDKSAAEMGAALADTRAQMLADQRPTTEWPLFEINASRLPGSTTRLHICFDLLNVDAGSVSLVMRELGELYANPAARFDDVAVTFRDYSATLEQIEQYDIYQRSKTYWLERLPDFPAGPELPLAKQPGAIANPRFVRRKQTLNANTWSKVKAAALDHHVTLSSLLLTVYGKVLATWSNNKRLAINIPLFNRLPVHAQINDVVGPFTSVELLEIDNTAPGIFIEQVRQVQNQLMNDLDHRYFDGVRVMRELARVKKNKAATAMPVIFTSLIEQHFDEAFQKLGHITSAINQTAQVWMDLHVDEDDGALVVKWDAVDELFPDGLVQDMLNAYCAMLNQLGEDPSAWERRQWPLLPPAQLQRRNEINATDAPLSDALLHALIADKAAQQPDAPAVIAPEHTLTYGELNKLSNQIGRKLRSLGCQPNQLVAIVMEKGWEQIPAVLGVLHAGAAYLPIDPEFPQARIQYLIEHGQVDIVLTQSWLNDTLTLPDNVTCLNVDNEDWQQQDDSPLAAAQTARDLAYVIYTSGSTGTPKGVMIEHRSVVNRMLDINQRYRVTADDRVIALTALQHDLSVYDVFGTLIAGAAIVIPDAHDRTDPAYLADLVIEEGITVWNSVPAFLDIYVDYLEQSARLDALRPHTLRFVILAGDWIPVKLPERLQRIAPDAMFIASGGPTENTIWDIYNHVTHVDPDRTSIPYGRPLTNSSYYILDQNLQPCPDWVTGEMYVGGAGLARGYWRDDAKTAQSFIQHPVTGELLYKSGDLGRFLPDGNIEFIGRADFQVKLRGYRIETGEIETALQQREGIKDAIVTAVGETANDRRLVAYLVEGSRSDAANDNAKPQQNKTDDGIIKDPIERAEFKLKRYGVRQDLKDNVSLDLPTTATPEDLKTQMLGRQSYRMFSETPLALQNFSEFLQCMQQVQFDDLPLPKTLYPSAGGLYPVQAYLYVKPNRIAGLTGGTYYYHPDEHRLVLINEGVEIDSGIHTRNNHHIADASAFSIYLVGDDQAIAPLYGKNVRDFYMLEAGYIGQLMMMIAPRHNIGLCPIGGAKFDRVSELFNVDGNHVYLHCLIGGKIDEGQQQRFTLLDEAQGTTGSSGGKKDNSAKVEQIRRDLKARLPDYMVPSAFVFLDALPLTANGKIDRRALPDPFVDTSASHRYEAPHTAAEKLIAQLWQDAVGIDRVGIHDNFFDIGGHSLAAIQVIAKLQRATGVRLSPRAMVSDSLKQIALQCEGDWQQADTAESPAIAPGQEVTPTDKSLFKRIKDTFSRT